MLSDISEIHLRMPEAWMKRVGFSLWKGLWLIFVQSDIKTCSSLLSPCPQSDPQINTSDLVKFETSYKFYLSWQNNRRFISCVAFTLCMEWWPQVGVVGSVLWVWCTYDRAEKLLWGQVALPVVFLTKLCTARSNQCPGTLNVWKSHPRTIWNNPKGSTKHRKLP